MKKKIIILFVVLLILSWVSAIFGMTDKPREYQKFIDKAEEQEEKEVYIGAIEAYQNALNLKPDDVAILNKIALNYKLINDSSNYVSTLEKIVELNTDGSKEALEELMNYYIDDDSESKASRYIKRCAERFPDVDYVQTWYLKLKGSYSELYCTYDEMFGIYDDNMVVKSGEVYTVVDSSGNKLLESIYKEITPFFKDGYARTVSERGNVIFIDKDGLTRIAPDDEYTNIGIMINSRIAASMNGKYGYLDQEGEQATEFIWEDITAFNQIGFAKQNGKWAIINEKGKEKTDYIFEDVITDEYGIGCRQSRAFVKQNGKYQIISSKGKEVGSLQFDDAKLFTRNGYAAVCNSNKWGFVNEDGELVIDFQYEDAKSFSNGMAAVFVEGKWGYIDEENNLIIPPTFIEATDFSSEGTAAVKILRDHEGENDGEVAVETIWRIIRLNM